MRTLFSICFLFLLAIAHGQPQTYPNSFIVAQDGTGNFTTIQEAINAVRDLSQQTVTIHIRKGVYREKLVIPSWKTHIVLLGQSPDSTVITWNDHTGKPYPGGKDLVGKKEYMTFTSYTLLVQGNDIRLENLTIENSAGRVGQAVALHAEGDRLVVRNCRLLGNQDTLYAATDGSRQYYERCTIEGTTDFIFGEATVVFESCRIRSKTNSFITAASTRPYTKYGFVFVRCELTADSAGRKVYLGRPWRPYAKTVFIECRMGDHIRPEGWENWRNPGNEATAYYAEYRNTGPGADVSKRVGWSHQLSRKERKRYTLERIFNGWKVEGL
jgi:pectinesterase